MLRFGFMLLPRDPEQTRQVAQTAEALGFSWLGIADSPVVYQESYLHLVRGGARDEADRDRPGGHACRRAPSGDRREPAGDAERADRRPRRRRRRHRQQRRAGVQAAPRVVRMLREGIEAIRSYWRGEGGRFGESEIPARGIERRACPLLVSSDGPKAAEVAGQVGDGMLYGGTLQPELLARPVAAARAVDPAREVWAAPSASLETDREIVKLEIGAIVVAMANLAVRGDLDERGIPPELQDDVREMWSRYDYAFHADTTRPRNLSLVSRRLADHLTDATCIWGDAERWDTKLDAIEEAGCDAVHFVVGQSDPLTAVRDYAGRLRELGRL